MKGSSRIHVGAFAKPLVLTRDIKQYWLTARVCEIRLDGFVLLRLLHGTTNTAEPAVVAMIMSTRAIITNKVRNPCCIDRKDVESS